MDIRTTQRHVVQERPQTLVKMMSSLCPTIMGFLIHQRSMDCQPHRADVTSLALAIRPLKAGRSAGGTYATFVKRMIQSQGAQVVANQLVAPVSAHRITCVQFV